MHRNDSYDEERIFQKLEQEASRHRHSSSERRRSEKVVKSQKSSETERPKKKTAGQSFDQSVDVFRKTTGLEKGTSAETKKHPDSVRLQKIQNSVEQDMENDAPDENGSINKIIRPEKTEKRKKEKSIGASSNKRRNLGWIRVCGAVMALIVLLSSSGFLFLHAKLNKIVRTDGLEDTINIDDEFDKDNPYGLEEYGAKLMASEDVTNILLVGQDRRKGDAAQMRSDAMIVCSINKKTGAIILSSLMRDMYLPIPGKGYGMINATYLAGGFDLLDETIEKNFGIRIDGNIEVDFDRFIGLMSLIGPIELNLSKEEAEHLRDSGYSVFKGNNSMDSEQVLAYCRMRKNIGGDWGRTDRQRKVITQIYQKLRGENISTIYSFIDEALPLFRTDLSNRKIIQLAYAMLNNGMRIAHSYRFPEEGTYTQEIREENLHVLIPDLRENCRRIQKYIYGNIKKGE